MFPGAAHGRHTTHLHYDRNETNFPRFFWEEKKDGAPTQIFSSFTVLLIRSSMKPSV